jgi:formimidoylglutamate deiminase
VTRRRIAIGSDSNIRISLSKEMRTLEYSQRLRDRSRVVLADKGRSSGRYIFDAITEGGAMAARRMTGKIAKGYWADLMVLDNDAIQLAGRDGDTIIDSFVFAGDDRLISDVWSAGRHMVQNGQYTARDIITANYRTALESLSDVI